MNNLQHYTTIEFQGETKINKLSKIRVFNLFCPLPYATPLDLSDYVCIMLAGVVYNV